MCVAGKVSESAVSRYLEDVRKDYPEIDGNPHDLLIQFFARALVFAHKRFNKDEEITFQRCVDILTEESTEDVAIDNLPEIIEKILCNWSEVKGNKEAEKIIVGGCSYYRLNFIDLTVAWKGSPFSTSEATAV